MREPRVILEVEDSPVLAPGRVGEFDESGAMGSWMVQYGSTKYLYYIGWNRGTTVPFRNSIGLATSDDDGRNFRRYSEGPILDRSVHDPCFVANPCVVIEGVIWRMWYLSCIRWEVKDGSLRHYYHIKYAESSDGLSWVRRGHICIDFKNQSEYAISRPCVLRDGSLYRMWYSYRGDAYRIGYAESRDGVRWTRKDEEAGIDVSKTGWDSEMIEYPFVFDHRGKRYMLYNGNGYGRTGIGLAVLEDE